MRAYALILAAILITVPGAPARAAENVPNEVLVELRPGTNILAFVLTFGLRVLDQSAFAPVYRLGVAPGRDLNVVLGILRLSPVVVVAEPNQISRSMAAEDPEPAPEACPPPDPCPAPEPESDPSPTPDNTPSGGDDKEGAPDFNDQLTSTFDPAGGPGAYQGQSGVAQVRFHRSSRIANGSGVTVAILDTGISRRPAAIRERTLAGWNFIDDNSNFDDAPAGLDYDRDGRADEAVGHGTMIGGIILRFAPAANLLPVKVGNSDGYGTLWAATEGIRYSVAQGARVLNLSFGFKENSNLLNRALREARSLDAVVVASAGNGDTRSPQYPAASGEVLSVAAVAVDDTKARFSNYGSSIDVAAPGVDIVGTYWDGSYTAWSGTSFAAPFVAAQATLIRSRSGQLSAGAVRDRIVGTARPIDNANPNYVRKLGRGVVDFDASLSGF